jgi:putative transcriptional regulator
MDTSIDVALRLEEIFDRELIKAVDIFMPSQVDIESAEIEDGILQHLAEIGLQVFPMFQAPFNAITRGDEMTFLTGIGRFSSGTVKRARLMSNLSSIAMTRSAVIIDGETRINRIEETALIELKELKGIDKGRDFADLVMEKQARDEPDFAGKL